MSNDMVNFETDFEAMITDTHKTTDQCRKLMATKHYQKLGEEGIFAIVQMAKTLGIHPGNALNGEMYFTQGRVGMYAEAMSKYIRMKGHSIITKELTANKCIMVGTRKDNGDSATITYTIDDARKAGLIKPGTPWEKHPMSMLWSRGMSLLKKVLFSDLLANVLTNEELKDMEREKGVTDDIEVKVSDVKPLYIEEMEETISPEQTAELEMFLDLCSMKYQEEVMDTLRKMNPSIKSFANLPMSLYSRLKIALIKNKKTAADPSEQSSETNTTLAPHENAE